MKQSKLYILSLLTTAVLAQESEHFHKHHVDVFLGATLETNTGSKSDGKDKKSVAAGIEYQYRLNTSWGVGAAFETIGEDTIREQVYVLPVTYHINHDWSVFAGPGYEEDGHHGNYLLRAGFAYEYDLGSDFNLEPKFMADFIEGGRTTWVAGIALGYGF